LTDQRADEALLAKEQLLSPGAERDRAVIAPVESEVGEGLLQGKLIVVERALHARQVAVGGEGGLALDEEA